MKKWKCRVERHRVWRDIIVEADNREDAEVLADKAAREQGEWGCDDYAYDTEARPVDDDE